MNFPEELLNGIWHTTNIERFHKIMETGYIAAEPDIPNKDRWKANSGSEYYPYVRSVGGISLFDFRYFEEEKYSKDYPLSNWHIFVPFFKEWEASIWIEIDYEALENNFLTGKYLIDQWNEQKAYNHTIMPIIEAASLISIPVSLFKRIMISSSEHRDFQPYKYN